MSVSNCNLPADDLNDSRTIAYVFDKPTLAVMNAGHTIKDNNDLTNNFVVFQLAIIAGGSGKLKAYLTDIYAWGTVAKATSDPTNVVATKEWCQRSANANA